MAADTAALQRVGQLANILERNRDHFLSGGQPTQNFAHAIFPERPHAEFTGALAQEKSGAAIVDHVAHVIVDRENFEDSHPPFVTGVAALLAAHRLHDLRFAQL